MPFPDNWPPTVGTYGRSGRFYTTGTATADFEDSAYLFSEGAGVGDSPISHATGIIIRNTGGGDLEFSFDGTNVHGKVKEEGEREFSDRSEGGIAIRGAGVGFEIEAW